MNPVILNALINVLTPKSIKGFITALITKVTTGKTLLSYSELVQLVDAGVINAKHENINATSIDITLDDILMVEIEPNFSDEAVDMSKKESINMAEFQMDEEGYEIEPNEFILASSSETFNLPDNISAEYKLKSTQARNGLDHLNASWVDAGFSGKLTLEFKNINRWHYLKIRAGMKCGQVVFFKHKKVPKHASYSVTGQYHGQTKVQPSKELK